MVLGRRRLICSMGILSYKIKLLHYKLRLFMSEVDYQVLEFLDGATPADKLRHRLEEQGDGLWSVNNSTIDDYSSRANFWGHPGGLKFIIDAQIGGESDNVGLDIAAGSDARALRDLLDSGVLRLALATNYEDRRPDAVINDSRLAHIDGKLTDPATLAGVVDWKKRHAPRGFAIVMHRPIGGLQTLPFRTYRGASHLMLDMTRSGGLTFTQVPRNLVASPRVLAGLCASIRQRSDVAEVIVSPPKPPYTHVDSADLYAIILKR